MVADPTYYLYSRERSPEFHEFSMKQLKRIDKFRVLYSNEITISGPGRLSVMTFYFVILSSYEYLQVLKELLFDNWPWHLSEQHYFWDVEFLRLNAKHAGSDFEKDLWRWYYLLEEHGFQVFVKRYRLLKMKITFMHILKAVAKQREDAGLNEYYITEEYMQERSQSAAEEEIGMRLDTALAFCYLLVFCLCLSFIGFLCEVAWLDTKQGTDSDSDSRTKSVRKYIISPWNLVLPLVRSRRKTIPDIKIIEIMS